MEKSDYIDDLELSSYLIQKYGNEEDFLNLFHYLEQKAYSNFDEKIKIFYLGKIANMSLAPPLVDTMNILKYQKARLKTFVKDSSSSIFGYLRLFSDCDSYTLNEIIKKLQPRISIINHDAYDQMNFYPETFILNIYTFLATGAKDERYLQFLKGEIPPSNMDKLLDIKRFIDYISNMILNDNMDFDDFLLGVLKEMTHNNFSYDVGVTLDDETINLLKKIKREYETRANDCFFSKTYYIDTINYILNNKFLINNPAKREHIYYTEVLLLTNSLAYFNEKLDLIGDNESIKEEVLGLLASIEPSKFLINYDSKETPNIFREIMDVVFDSDTFVELKNKLLELKRMTEQEDLELLPLKEILTKLNDSSLKEKIGDAIISFEDNFQNMVEKPDSIYTRSNNIYHILLKQRIDFAKLYHSSQSIEQLNEACTSNITTLPSSVVTSQVIEKNAEIGLIEMPNVEPSADDNSESIVEKEKSKVKSKQKVRNWLKKIKD